MFATRYKNRNNICGLKLEQIRSNSKPFMPQIKMSEKLQLAGMDCDRHVIRRIENGKRFVTDIELKLIAEALGVNIEFLLE